MQDLYNGIAEILEVPAAEIRPDFELGQGWDSLAVVSTIALIDDLFNKVANGQSLGRCEKVSDIVSLIELNPA